MVNIPPIPPLLCSTPPPIDFGNDEDLDSIPPSLDDVEDDFGGFIVDDGIKTDEPLPSPRPPSVCDLPSVSIYDGLVPPDENEEFTRHTKTSSQQSPDAKNLKSKNITEAFNFEVKNFTKDERNVLKVKTKSPAKANKAAQRVQQSTEIENVASKIQETEQDIQTAGTDVLSKNIKDLKIVPVNDAVTCIVNKSNEAFMQNIVSIEDIEDDLSDDELYSPKTPKNFIEPDNMTDLFKIEEIKTLTAAGNNIIEDSEITDSKSSESKDNNKSASLDNKNDNEFKSFSSNSFIQDQFVDKPPPLTDHLNDIANEVDDDFGGYADFQETHFVNNAVPVENVYTNKHKRDLEINDFNGFANFNNAANYSNFNNSQIYTHKVKHVKEENEKMREDFESVPSNKSSLIDEFVTKGKDITDKKNDKVDSLRSANQNCNDYKTEENESNQPVKQLRDDDNSLSSDLSEVPATADNEDFGNFAEFSCIPPDCENMNVNNIETNVTCFSGDNDNSDDEYSDFADFESHENITKPELAGQLSTQEDVKQQDEKADDDVDDEDDFGDFNTAEPVAPSSIVTNASQNINPQTPVIAPSNLNERISKILHLMFNQSLNLVEHDSDEFKADKIQDIPFTSIDSAKALEYQWLSSDTRHSFIRSLGIDSRNILYGDNWNPSLPRFAANLSFNPLKPMKPVPSSNIAGNTISAVLESIPVTSAETNRAVEISGSIKKEPLDLNWKSSIAQEQTIEAFKENNLHAPIDAAAFLPYTTNEPQTVVPESVTVFENTYDNEGKLPKTPPISEMESVTSFTSSLPNGTMDLEFSTQQTELEANTSSLNINEVVVTSTFTGSFKETHIYTPSKTNDFEIKHAIATPPTTSSSPTKSSPIDFDYEKAAMGVIIDETVVKKEYRDVEYNPPFSKSVSPKMDFFEANSYSSKNMTTSSLADKTEVDREDEEEAEDTNDEFSEFQSVQSEVAMPTTSKPLAVPKITSTTVSHGGMILSPAILIPQAISLENQKPKIEWGDSTATINPEELARIEELFPEPKSLKSASSSQKSTPTHQAASAPSISATVANKELEGNINNTNDDDDDWSDFVSVTVTNNISANRAGSNNNVLTRSPAGSSYQQRSAIVTNKIPPATASNSNNDDEWSDFVSSAPPMQQPNTYRVPQFNSGAWQNANFYNNPLSMYHKGPLNIPTTAAPTHSAQKYLYNNNNNYNISQQSYPMANNMPSTGMTHHQQPPPNNYKQQVHVMQNFSTAPIPTPERLSAAAGAAAKNNQFQSIGSAKVAPSIALIPDLGFVAPAIPTQTSFINSLPKPSINMKK